MAERGPNFLVVGAPKSGTTSLYFQLRQHPDIFVPRKKELHFFTGEHLRSNTQGPGDADAAAEACRTWSEYASHFAEAARERIVAEFSPSYLYFSDVAQDIRATLPEARVLMILRDPVEKAYSQYMHLVRDGRESLPFRDALRAEDERRAAGWSDIWRYAESSLYSARVERYLDVFGRDRVFIALTDELAADAAGLLRRIFDFLGVDADAPIDTDFRYNRSGPARSARLAAFLARPGGLKAVARWLLPERVRGPLRVRLQDWNTGRSAGPDAASIAALRVRFAADVARLAGLMGRAPPWPREPERVTESEVAASGEGA